MRIKILISITFLSGFINAQTVSLTQVSPIIPIPKPLQFGNNLKIESDTFYLGEFDSNSIELTEYNKYYYQKYLHYDPVRDPKRLVYNIGLFLGTALASFGLLWILPESFTNWDKEEILEYGMLNRWKDNVKAGPVWDKDGIFLNWIMHPWAGGVYYMSARGSGFKKWESFVYSALMSTLFWEYGIEAFAEIPSWQDLLITPILGSLLGEQFFKWKGKIIKNERKLFKSKMMGGVAMFIMDPFNQVLNGLGYKTKHKIKSFSTIAPISYDMSSNRAIWGMQVIISF